MKIIRCSRCKNKVIRGFPCPNCNPRDKIFRIQTYIALKEEEFRLFKKELRNTVDETTYNQIINNYNHKLQQLRKEVLQYLKD